MKKEREREIKSVANMCNYLVNSTSEVSFPFYWKQTNKNSNNIAVRFQTRFQYSVLPN